MPGGDLTKIVRIGLDDGRDAVVKDGPDPLAEAGMLRAIRTDGVPAPELLAADASALVLEHLPRGRGGRAEADLGRVLVRLHAVAGARYGGDRDYAFGPVAIDNRWSEHWPGFWAERQLLCHEPDLAPALGRRIKQLAARLSKRLPPRPRPVLLHGDL